MKKKIQKDDEKIELNGKLRKLEVKLEELDNEKKKLQNEKEKLQANLDQAVDKDTVRWYREQITAVTNLISKKEDQLTEVMKQISGLQNQTPAGSSLLFSSLLFSLLFSSLLFSSLLFSLVIPNSTMSTCFLVLNSVDSFRRSFPGEI